MQGILLLLLVPVNQCADCCVKIKTVSFRVRHPTTGDPPRGIGKSSVDLPDIFLFEVDEVGFHKWLSVRGLLPAMSLLVVAKCGFASLGAIGKLGG